MGFSTAPNSGIRHVPVLPLTDNSDRQKQTNCEPSASNSSAHEQREAVEKPRRPRRLRIRVRQPADRTSRAGKTRTRRSRPTAPLLGPELGGVSPQTQALLVIAFIVTALLLWHFLQAFR